MVTDDNDVPRGHSPEVDRVILNTKINALEQDLATVIKGCHALIDMDSELDKRLDILSERMDIANIRIRKLEQKTKGL